MELSSTQPPSATTSTNNTQTQEIASEELKTNDQDTLQSTDITVNISQEAFRSLDSSEQKTSSSVNSEDQARQATEQAQQDINDSPNQALAAQSGQVTSDLTSNLLSN